MWNSFNVIIHLSMVHFPMTTFPLQLRMCTWNERKVFVTRASVQLQSCNTKCSLLFGHVPHWLFAKLQARETWLYFVYCHAGASVFSVVSSTILVRTLTNEGSSHLIYYYFPLYILTHKLYCDSLTDLTLNGLSNRKPSGLYFLAVLIIKQHKA